MRTSRLCPSARRRACRAGRVWLSAVAFCLVSATAARGWAEEALPTLQAPSVSEAARFEWSAPAGCPSRAQVLDTLSQSLVLDPGSWDHVDRVRGQISPEPAGWELTLEFQHGRQVLRRRFVTRDCTDLAQAAAASLALVLDPGWDWTPAPAPAETPGLPSSNAGTDEPTQTPDPVASAGSEGRGQIAFSMGADGVLDATTFGREAFGISALGRANFEGLGAPLSAELFGTWLPDRRIAVRTAEAIHLGLLAGGARGCWSARAALGFCADLELGRLSASAVGLGEGRTKRDLWIAPGPSVVLSSVALGSVRLNARVALLVPLVRPHYFVNQTELVHDVPGYALRVSLGATVPVF
jgi:hypothetical protein